MFFLPGLLGILCELAGVAILLMLAVPTARRHPRAGGLLFMAALVALLTALLPVLLEAAGLGLLAMDASGGEGLAVGLSLSGLVLLMARPIGTAAALALAAVSLFVALVDRSGGR